MGLLSTVDHFSDIWVVAIWFSSTQIPTSIPVLGLIAIAMTTLLPMIFYDECYIKCAMPYGLGKYYVSDF